MDSPKCQTVTVSPAKPGDFPSLVNPYQGARRIVDGLVGEHFPEDLLRPFPGGGFASAPHPGGPMPQDARYARRGRCSATLRRQGLLQGAIPRFSLRHQLDTKL